MDIGAWLRELGLERYESIFRDNDIDWDVLPELGEADYKEIGLPLGARRKIIAAVARLSPDQLEAEAPLLKAPRGEAERRQLTVLFCDLVGLNELAARVDPEDLTDLIRAFQQTAADEVTRFEGHVGRFMADGLLAYFGFPTAHEDEAERAVRAGLALVEAVARLTGGERGLAARVGIATGPVVVGDLVGEHTAKDTVLGETPNLAARLQGLARPGAVVIGPSTRRLLAGLFDLEDLGEQALKGFQAPVQAWRVLGTSLIESRFEALRGERLTPLIGREHELGMLAERWSWSKAGDGQVVLLSGEPGIGKSRLARALREQIADEHHIAVTHHCSPYYRGSPLHPVIEHLRRAAKLVRGDPPERELAKLEALFDLPDGERRRAVRLIGDLLEIPATPGYPPLDLTPEQHKQQVLAELLDQLKRLALHRPVLLVVEDLHWSDPTTLELMDRTVDAVRHLPVLVLITCRPEAEVGWIGFPNVTVLTLNRLGRHQGAGMARSVAGGKSLPPEVLEQIVERTGGVPLFVEELTKAVMESGLLAELGDHYELVAPVPVITIPATLQDSLMARLDRLAPVREIAQIGAVLGTEFSQQLIAAVADLPPAQLQSGLDRLVASGLLFRRGQAPDATYTFKHGLVQDAAYQSLLKSRRLQLHARIGQLLETQYPEVRTSQPEILAQHCAGAGLTDKAVGYWRLAGQRAAERSANAEAAAHYQAALHLLATLPESLERDRRELDVLTALGSILISTKGHADREIGAVYRRAQLLCGTTGTSAHVAEVLQGLRHAHLGSGDLQAAGQVSEELLRFGEQSGRADHRLEGHRALASVHFFLGNFEAALHHAEQGVELYEPAEHSAHALRFEADPGVTCLAYAGLSLWALGHPDKARSMTERGRVLAAELAHAYTRAEAQWWHAKLSQLCRDVAHAQDAAEAALTIAEEYRFPLWSSGAAIIRGWARIEQGDESGLDELRAGVAAFAAQYRTQLPQELAVLAAAYGHLGQIGEGLACISQALETMDQTGTTFWRAELLRIKGVLQAQVRPDEPAEAEATLLDALAAARAQRARMLELRVAVDLARLRLRWGRQDDARDLLAPVYDSFGEGFDIADLDDARVLLASLT